MKDAIRRILFSLLTDYVLSKLPSIQFKAVMEVNLTPNSTGIFWIKEFIIDILNRECPD